MAALVPHGKGRGDRGRGGITDEDGVDVVLLADLAGLAAGALLLALGRLPLRLLLPLPRLLLLLPHLLPSSSESSPPLPASLPSSGVEAEAEVETEGVLKPHGLTPKGGVGESRGGGDWEPRRRLSDWASMGFHKFRPEKRIWASKLSARESSSSSLSFCLSVMRWDFVVFSRSVFASILI